MFLIRRKTGNVRADRVRKNRALPILLTASLAWLTPASASVINSTGDASDNNAGDGSCDTGGTNSQSNTECTLRAAIQEANAYARLDTITFNMPTTEPGYNASPLSYTI